MREEQDWTAACRDARGVVYVEYVLIVAFFAFPIAGAAIQLGFPLLRAFRYAQLALAGPFP